MTDPIGRHVLRDGSSACGVGLAFGHASAETFERLTQAAETSGATGLRVAADRALLVVGLTPKTLPIVTAAAESLGFVVRGDDPRRYVIACAGAPICAAAYIAARSIAPSVAAAAAGQNLDSHFRIHISGCAKGCAHAGAASVTIVGRDDGCAVIANGSVHDAPVALAPANELPALVAALTRKAKHGAGHV